jgi:hypothetical protein
LGFPNGGLAAPVASNSQPNNMPPRWREVGHALHGAGHAISNSIAPNTMTIVRADISIGVQHEHDPSRGTSPRRRAGCRR